MVPPAACRVLGLQVCTTIPDPFTVSICLIFNLKMLLRQGLSMRLICNSLCRSGWPKTHRTLPACLPKAEIIGVGHQTWPFSKFFQTGYSSSTQTNLKLISALSLCAHVYMHVCVRARVRVRGGEKCMFFWMYRWETDLTLGVFLYCSPHYV